MTQLDIILPAETAATPVARRLATRDVFDALREGFDDFRAMPTHVAFLCLIYPLVGLFLANATFNANAIPLLYPLAAGFALVGPLAGVWMFELSRRRELGLDTSWRHAFDVIHSPSFPAMLALGALLLAILALWIATAQAIYVSCFGYAPMAVEDFARRVLTTPEGHRLILLGNLVGLPFAIVAASISVLSFPLLLDRHVGFAAAVAASVRAVVNNPGPMALWGLIVAALLALGSIPLFIGLAVVVPILGHATWRLYRKAIAPEVAPRPIYQPRRTGRRHAADFPAALFFPSRDIDEN